MLYYPIDDILLNIIGITDIDNQDSHIKALQSQQSNYSSSNSEDSNYSQLLSLLYAFRRPSIINIVGRRSDISLLL